MILLYFHFKIFRRLDLVCESCSWAKSTIFFILGGGIAHLSILGSLQIILGKLQAEILSCSVLEGMIAMCVFFVINVLVAKLTRVPEIINIVKFVNNKCFFTGCSILVIFFLLSMTDFASMHVKYKCKCTIESF